MRVKKIKKRVLTILLTLCMAASIIPATGVVAASPTYTYQDLWDGKQSQSLVISPGDCVEYSDIQNGPNSCETIVFRYVAPLMGEESSAEINITNPEERPNSSQRQEITVPKNGGATDLQIKKVTYRGVKFDSWVLSDFREKDGKMLLSLMGVKRESSIKFSVKDTNGRFSYCSSNGNEWAGEEVLFDVSPNDGYEFDFAGIEKTPADLVITEIGTAGRYKFTMPNEPVEIKGSFVIKGEATHKVTVQNDGNGSGTATPSAAKKGGKVTLAATPNNGYQFKEWQVISGGVTISNNEFTMPNEDVTVKAIFEKKTEPINPQPTAPTITSGENGTHQIGTGENLLFTFSEALNGLIGIYVDGKAVDPSNYMMNMYNTALSLKSGYLDTLPAGKHTLLIRCADDISVSTEFTVKSKAASNTTGDNKTKTDVKKVNTDGKKTNTVQTGDTTNISLYLCLLSLSAIAIYIMAHLKKKKFL